MNTRLLAKELNLIEVIEVETARNKYSVQPFDYLIVLDFEATCWEKSDLNRGYSEIIEFPAVLYDIKKYEIVEEFQQYVMPTENHKLSKFCIELTGITQSEVDNGIPLGTCLMLFTKWLRQQTIKYNLVFPKKDVKGNCVFMTWSDWDLATCLFYECKRKRVHKSDIFNKWVDLKALYREYYYRRPKGLNGALNEVGLLFRGKQHCGLHDARNTAYLAGHMISDGITLRLTRDLDGGYLEKL